MHEPPPTSFEQERDDLLAHYEASPAYRPAGDYTPEQFDGRYRTYLPKLQSLLHKYVQAYPHFRDVLGLELSRPRRPGHDSASTIAYEFDGLMLPERLARRVSRLKLPAGALVFPALNPQHQHGKGMGALHQRSHFHWALKIVNQLAGATTRHMLTFPLLSSRTSLVVSALQRLRAFGPDDTQLQLAVGASLGVDQWWEQCGMRATRADLRVATRADHEAAFATHSQQNVPELSLAAALEFVAAANTATQVGQCPHGFSPAFYWRYFTCTVIPAAYHAPETRVATAVAALYQLATHTASRQAKSQKTLAVEVLQVVEQLTSEAEPAAHQLAKVFFSELNRQLQGVTAAERLLRHLALSRLSRQPSLVHAFYQAVGTYLDVQDVEEAEWADCLLELAQVMDADARLRPGREELASCAASICEQLYTALDLSSVTDQGTLRRLYPILVHCLPETELATLEELMLEQMAEEPASADQWLAEDGTLAQRLRRCLRQRLEDRQISFGSREYAHHARLLTTYTPANESHLNHLLFARRYDMKYFMQLA